MSDALDLVLEDQLCAPRKGVPDRWLGGEYEKKEVKIVVRRPSVSRPRPPPSRQRQRRWEGKEVGDVDDDGEVSLCTDGGVGDRPVDGGFIKEV